jgi:hypothetical protein
MNTHRAVATAVFFSLPSHIALVVLAAVKQSGILDNEAIT